VNRRAFLKGFGAATIAGAVPMMAAAGEKVTPDVISDPHSLKLNLEARRHMAYRKRVKAAAEDRKIKTPTHSNNGDEALYPSGIANFTKGFAHDNFGIVDPGAYAAYLAAIRSGKRADFDALVMGGNTPLVDPQARLAFDLETCDPSSVTSQSLFRGFTAGDLKPVSEARLIYGLPELRIGASKRGAILSSISAALRYSW
jgi:hypothetical protein